MLTESQRFESLDSVRGLAAGSVVVFHVLVSFPVFYYAYYNFEFGNQTSRLLTLTPLHTIMAGQEAVHDAVHKSLYPADSVLRFISIYRGNRGMGIL